VREALLARTKLLRSHLYAPGANRRILSKVLDAGADAVILDLEDAVAPSEKDTARGLVADLVTERATSAPCDVHVRINRTADGWDHTDVAAVTLPGLASLRLAKAEDGDHVRALDDYVSKLETDVGLEVGAIGFIPLVETAVGVLAAQDIAASSPRVSSLAFGAADFLADVSGRGEEDGEPTLYARAHLVLACRAAQVGAPSDGVHTAIGDDAGLRRAAERARDLGFFGKSCIHPRQILVVHDVFTPGAEEIAFARRVITAFDEAAGDGVAALVVDGEFVDPAVAARARALLALAPDGHNAD
jgi:citrate lyase subunit beta/citryl-CoA lyase